MFTPLLEDSSNASPSNLTRVYQSSFITSVESKREENLVGSYKEIKASVDHENALKNRYRADYQKFLQETEVKISQNKEAVFKLDKKIEKLESSKKSQFQANSEKILKIEEFKNAIQSVKLSVDVLENSKEKLSFKLETLRKELDILNTEKEAKQEELELKIYELNNANSDIKDCREKIREISKLHKPEYIELFLQKKALTKLKKIEDDERKIKEDISNIESEISKLNSLAEKEKRKIEDQENPELIKSRIESLTKEIEKIEKILNEKSLKHGCKNIWEVLIDSQFKESCSFKDIIFQQQFSIMKRKKVEVMSANKQAELESDKKMLDLNNEIRRLEIQYYEFVRRNKKNTVLVRILQNKRRIFDKFEENFEILKRKNMIKNASVEKWLSLSKAMLSINENCRFPEDQLVIGSYLSQFTSKNIEFPELDVLKNISKTYLEKAAERNSLILKLENSETEDKKLAEEKSSVLVSLKAEIQEKSSIIEQKNSLMAALLNEEKILNKQIDSYRSEIESEKTRDILELVSRSKFDLNSAKTSAVESLKARYIESSASACQILKKLLENKSKIKELGKSIVSSIKEDLNPALAGITRDITAKYGEIKKLEEDFILIENSKEELLNKLCSLADRKREEIYLTLKKINKKPSSQFDSIEKLYQQRSMKEDELVEFELEIIKQQKILSEKELKSSLELIKLSTRAEVLEKELKNIKKNTKKNALQILEIDSPTFNNKEEPNIPAVSRIETNKITTFNSEVVSQNENSIQKSRSYNKISDMYFQIDIHRNNMLTPDCSFHLNDFCSDQEFEIPLPFEPNILFSGNSTFAERKLFESILPILRGSVLYKKSSNKKLKKVGNFDPLEFNVLSPEDCGFDLRKIRLNKNITKIETRQIGKQGIESSIMIDSLVSVSPKKITNYIIRAQKVDTKGWDSSLEALAKHSKDYRNMKVSGKVDYNANYFIMKSKETHFYPFCVELKGGKLELVADSLKDYLDWTQGLQSLINSRKALDKLKFKVQIME